MDKNTGGKKVDPFLPGPVEKEQDEVWEHMQEHIKKQEYKVTVSNIKELTALIDADVVKHVKTKKLINELKKHYDE